MAPQCHAQGSSLNSQITLMLTGVLLAHAGLSQFFCFLGPLFFLKCFFAVSCSERLSCVKVELRELGEEARPEPAMAAAPGKVLAAVLSPVGSLGIHRSWPLCQVLCESCPGTI